WYLAISEIIPQRRSARSRAVSSRAASTITKSIPSAITKSIASLTKVRGVGASLRLSGIVLPEIHIATRDAIHQGTFVADFFDLPPLQKTSRLHQCVGAVVEVVGKATVDATVARCVEEKGVGVLERAPEFEVLRRSEHLALGLHPPNFRLS